MKGRGESNHQSESELTRIPHIRLLKYSFWLSLCLTLVFVIFRLLILWEGSFLWLNNHLQVVPNSKLFPSSASGIKDVAMTIGATGVFFTWLLQSLGNTECGQPISTLINKLLRENIKLPWKKNTGVQFSWVTALFIFDVFLCIYFGNETRPDAAYIIPLVLLAPSVILWLLFMWVLCTLFLFSREKHREIAFGYLKDEIKCGGIKKEVALRNWQQEIPICIFRREDGYVSYYFQVLLGEVDTEDEAKWRKSVYKDLSDLVKKLNPSQLRSISPYIYNACEKDDLKYCKLLSVFFVVLTEMNSSEEKNFSEKWKSKYRDTWFYLTEDMQIEGNLNYLPLCLFAAYYTITNSLLEERISVIESKSIRDMVETLIKAYIRQKEERPTKELRDMAYCNIENLLWLITELPEEKKVESGLQKYQDLLDSVGLNALGCA